MKITENTKKAVRFVTTVCTWAEGAADLDDERTLFQELEQIRDAVDQAELSLITGLRSKNASWWAIGQLLGITKQAAQQRHDRLIRRTPESPVMQASARAAAIASRTGRPARAPKLPPPTSTTTAASQPPTVTTRRRRTTR